MKSSTASIRTGISRSGGTWADGGGDHQSRKVKDKLKSEMTKEELLNKLQEIQKENVNQQLWN